MNPAHMGKTVDCYMSLAPLVNSFLKYSSRAQSSSLISNSLSKNTPAKEGSFADVSLGRIGSCRLTGTMRLR